MNARPGEGKAADGVRPTAPVAGEPEHMSPRAAERVAEPLRPAGPTRSRSVVLILGGTGEARRLADALAAERTAVRVVSSLAGRTATVPDLPGEVRVGGFGGAAGLAAWLRRENVAAVVDATHPFAARISTAAARAAEECGVSLLALRRPGWTPRPGDDWHPVDSLTQAAERLAGLGERVFLTVGRQGIAPFAGCDRHWFLARCLEPPDPPVPARLEVLLDRGPFTVAGERELLRDRGIEVVVSKDSGGEATAAKLTAARELGLPVVLVRRPELPEGVHAVTEVAEAVGWVRRRVGE